MHSQRSSSANKFYVQKSVAKLTHLLFNRKVTQLQSKAQFFEGQVDPLHLQNIGLKQQLMALSKIVTSSTDLLRNLLPTHGHPAKKLKLQLASLTEISDMIKTDWLEMQKTLAKDVETIRILTNERDHWNLQYQDEFTLREQQVRDMQESKMIMKEQFQTKINALNQEISELLETQQSEKEKMREDFRRRLSIYDSTLKEYQIFKHETKLKNSDYERAIERLKGEIQGNLISFEENKKHLKEIYDKLMHDKLTQQAEGYDLMLKFKQEEKMSLLIQMSQIQEEHKRRTALRQLELKKLNDIKTSFQQEIGGLKNELWSKKIYIDKQNAQASELQNTISTLNSKNQSLLRTIQQREEEFKQQKIKFNQQIKKKSAEIDLIKKEGNKAYANLLSEKQSLQKELSQTTAQHKTLASALSRAQAQFNSKMIKMKEQWQQQAGNLKKQIANGKDQLQEQKKSLRLTKLMIEQQKMQHEQSVKQLKSSFKKKEAQMVSKYQLEMTTFKAQALENFDSMKRKLELQVKQVQIAANEELRLTMVDCNKKLTLQAQQFNKQIDVIKQQGNKIQNLLAKAESKIQNQQVETERLKYQHIKELQRVNQKNELEKQKLNEEMDKQMKEFQRSLQQKEAELSSIKADMQNQIKMLKQANAIDSMEQRFQSQINRLKEEFSDRFKQMQNDFKDKYQKLQQDSKQKRESLLSQHQQVLKTLVVEHNNSLIYIAQKAQNTFSFLNDQLLNGEKSVDLQQATPEQKRQHIITKINNLKTNLSERETKIAKLQQDLAQVEKHIEKRIKARKDELQYQKEVALKNCQKKITQITADCANKVKKIEKDRIQHTKIMYSEFQALKQQHQKQLSALYDKYKNLERLFAERPSRAEDLTKIKELINLQTKMDIQIQSYQKKMQTANQIVKYLNLELENYKDSYDIFGPNGQNKEIGILGQGIKQKEASSNQSLNESQQLMDAIKARKHQRFFSEGKLDQKKPLKEPPVLQKFLNSPNIKQLKIFEGQEDNQSVNMSSIEKISKQEKYSNLITPDNSKLLRERIKTQKSQKAEKGDNESEIIINAQNFIRLIKNKREENPVIKEQDENFTKKSYRKRKLGKKHPTIGHDHYF